MPHPTVIDTTTMNWTPSPSAGVHRKRLFHYGPAESGQVTSLVRFDPGSAFPTHEHPDGEEIFVLDGTFVDDRGTWPAGSYLLNPDGYPHAPAAPEGCTLFVKLRQYAGTDRHHVALQTGTLSWEPTECPTVKRLPLYEQGGFPDTMALERWEPGTDLSLQAPGGLDLFVLSGAFTNPKGLHGPGTWVQLPPGETYPAHTADGCQVYIHRVTPL